MIGAVLSLAALVPAALAARAISAALGLLGRGTPDPSEVDQLAAECDLLRAERDAARAKAASLQWRVDEEKKRAAQDKDEIVRSTGHALATASASVAAAEGEAARLRKELTEALQWRGVAASVEREAAEDRARLEEAIRERDDLRAAAQDFVDALDHGDCDNVFKCDTDRCHRVASQRTLDPYGDYCDEHAESMSPVDKSFAPALRALRAALPTEAGDG